MKKIKLDPEQLRVDTFAVTPDPRGREGTVRAHSPDFTRACWSEAESICQSCEDCYTEVSGCFTENHTVCDCDQAPSRVEDC